jgi:hypothetical protein
MDNLFIICYHRIFSFDELTILFQKMLQFLNNGNKTYTNIVNSSFSLIPKMLEVIDVYFREDDEKKEGGEVIYIDKQENEKEKVACKESFNNSSSLFFDLSGCLVIGDMHGYIAALLHVSDLIDKMMLPDDQYLNIFIYFFFIFEEVINLHLLHPRLCFWGIWWIEDRTKLKLLFLLCCTGWYVIILLFLLLYFKKLIKKIRFSRIVFF